MTAAAAEAGGQQDAQNRVWGVLSKASHARPHGLFVNSQGDTEARIARAGVFVKMINKEFSEYD